MKEQVPSKNLSILVTGGAGFIGSHLVEGLLAQGHQIVVLDNFNNFYNPATKKQNIASCLDKPKYTMIEGDIRDIVVLDKLFSQHNFDVVVHLAAMAGVRPSLIDPAHYMDVNVTGTQRLIDRIIACPNRPKLVFGSSSSVYGKRSGECFSESDRIDQPLSPYAASKAAGELICYSAYHTSQLNAICLRFFTVFGPRQRPDLAIHKFCRLIDEDKPIEVFGDGFSKRDYTFVEDIVTGIEHAITYDLPGFDIINLGRSEPVLLNDMIQALEQALGKKAKLIHKPFQTGDMPYTYASIDKAARLLGYKPNTSFEQGINSFVNWYQLSKKLVPTTK